MNVKGSWKVILTLRNCLNFPTQQQAAATTIYCATAPELTGISGQYYNNCYLCEPSKRSQDEQLGRALWSESERMIEQIFATSSGEGNDSGDK